MKKFSLNPMVLGLCALALVVVFSSLTLAQESSSDAARANCVKLGYLYHISPELNNGQAICVFPDKTWCDAQAFHAGSCRPTLNPNVFLGAPGPGSNATQLCSNRGGSLKSVHTPYGDVLVCDYPGMENPDIWFISAYSWLNRP